jgi:acetyl esterase/lipase
VEVVVIDYSLSPNAGPGIVIEECYAVWKVRQKKRFTILGGDSARGSITGGWSLN